MIELTTEKLSAEEFNFLTDSVGWGMREISVVEEALRNTLYSVCARENGVLVGYARLLGDKTVFLYVRM